MRTKIPRLHDIMSTLGLPTLIAILPKGQRQVAWALIGGRQAPTYRQVAAKLGIHVGTVYQHLRRIRENAPTLYELIMEERRRQLAVRHEQVVKRAEAHSRAWHRKQANRRYYYHFGRWPWERWR